MGGNLLPLETSTRVHARQIKSEKSTMVQEIADLLFCFQSIGSDEDLILDVIIKFEKIMIFERKTLVTAQEEIQLWLSWRKQVV